MLEQSPPFELFPGREFELAVPPGFPAVHEAYRGLRDQKDMVCGPYTLSYLLRAYGFNDVDGVPVTVDSVAAAAGSVLEKQNHQRHSAVEERIRNGELSEERVSEWSIHDHYKYPLSVASAGGCSPKGLVAACESITDGLVAAIPIPSVVDGTVQFTEERFGAFLSAALDESFGTQLILNYNLRHTLAPTGMLGHKYNPLALLTRWDDPEYFRTLDWDVGHFTSLAGRVRRSDSDREYLLIRDSYRSFGWNGYHLQPLSAIREGLVRSEDEREGGVVILCPVDSLDGLNAQLTDLDIRTGLWDNGSPYIPETDPFV